MGRNVTKGRARGHGIRVMSVVVLTWMSMAVFDPPTTAGGAAAQTVLVAAGDIACAPGVPVTATTCNQRQTAALVARLNPAVVLPLGDLVYPSGATVGFAKSYAPSWGAFDSISEPVPGNHEYGTPGAAGYFGYFGARATPRQPTCTSNCSGYYSYSLGSWHVVALNSRCTESTGVCTGLAAEATWLDHDLAAHPTVCTLAYMHNPLFSGGFGATAGVKSLWTVLQAHHADLVLAGHAHNYQRFLPQNPNGTASASGITEIIAGTGGDSLQILPTAPHQAARINHAFGVLKLTLNSVGWTTSFISTTGQVHDTTSGRCH